jgi:hypothetical protein
MYNTHLITDNPIAAHLGTEEVLLFWYITTLSASRLQVHPRRISLVESASRGVFIFNTREIVLLHRRVGVHARGSFGTRCFGAAQNAMR